MASQSSLRMRVATIRDLLAPDTSKRPCIAVRINRVPPTPPGPLLLTAGEEPPAETQAPAEPTRPAERHDGHVCGPHCVSLSINFAPRWEDSSVGAHSGSGRGDVQRLPESAAVGRDVEPQSDPPPSLPPAYGPRDGPADEAPRSPAPAAEPQAALVAPPALVSPLALEMRQEAMARARELSEEVRLLVPWWLPVAPSQLAACAIPWCHHEAAEHRAVRTRLPCRRCGFQADQHRSDGLALAVPLYARRVSPCDNYNAICVDQDDHDGCEHPGCTCRAYCRWVPPDPSDPRTALDVRTVEMARALAETREELARLQEATEAEQRELLRATSKPTDLGASPHSAPVFVEGEGR